LRRMGRVLVRCGAGACLVLAVVVRVWAGGGAVRGWCDRGLGGWWCWVGGRLAERRLLGRVGRAD
jgi:hypothetical protein